MLHLRLYRAGLPIVGIALLVALFSVVSRPAPLPSEPVGAPFDEERAAIDAATLINLAPERLPGSEDDAAAADWVEAELEGLEGGSVERDDFTGRFDGSEVELTNVLYRLPGETDELIVIAAPRDCAAGPCAASSASSTAVLLGLARTLSATHHRKSVLLVSTDGSAAGAAGSTRLAEQLAEAGESVPAAIVLTQSGVRETSGRAVIPWSTSARATSVQLLLTAEEVAEIELDRTEPPSRSTLSELVRLGIPAGLGEQAPLVGEGFDAIGLSGGGTRALPASEDESFYPETLAAMGRTALSLVRIVDAGPAELVHGPEARVPLAGKLLPGWVLALLSAALLLPLGLTALGSVFSARRQEVEMYPAIRWALSRSAPFIVAATAFVVLALIGIVPAPPFPFDPSDHQLDAGPVIVLAGVAGLGVAAYLWLRRRIPVPPSGTAATATLGATLFVGGALTWIVNPYLALLLGPSLHLWMWASYPHLPGGRSARAWMTISGVALALGILFVLGLHLGSGIGSAAWQLALMFTGGHFPLAALIPLALLAGCILALFEAFWTSWTDVRPPAAHVSRRRGPIPRSHHGREAIRYRQQRQARAAEEPDRPGTLRPARRPGRGLDAAASRPQGPAWDQAGRPPRFRS